MMHMPKKFCTSRWNVPQGLFFLNIVEGAEPFCDTNSWHPYQITIFTCDMCASFREFSKMLKGVRVCYWVDVPSPSPNKTSNRKVYQFKHEWKVMWVFEHPKGLKHENFMSNPIWLTSCWDNNPTKFVTKQFCSDGRVHLGAQWSPLTMSKVYLSFRVG